VGGAEVIDFIGPILITLGVLMFAWIAGGWLGIAFALIFIGFCLT